MEKIVQASSFYPPDVVRDALRRLYISQVPGCSPRWSLVSRAVGIPRKTLSDWFFKEDTGKTQLLSEDDHHAISVLRGEEWNETKQNWLAEMGELVQDTLRSVHGAVKDSKAQDAKNLAVTMGISIDKAMQLAGDATGRQQIDVNVNTTVKKQVARLPAKEINPELFASYTVHEETG